MALFTGLQYLGHFFRYIYVQHFHRIFASAQYIFLGSLNFFVPKNLCSIPSILIPKRIIFARMTKGRMIKWVEKIATSTLTQIGDSIRHCRSDGLKIRASIANQKPMMTLGWRVKSTDPLDLLLYSEWTFDAFACVFGILTRTRIISVLPVSKGPKKRPTAL